MADRIVTVRVRRLTCERCGHEWTPRRKEVRACPRCKSAWWDRRRGE